MMVHIAETITYGGTRIRIREHSYLSIFQPIFVSDGAGMTLNNHTVAKTYEAPDLQDIKSRLEINSTMMAQIKQSR